MMKTRRTFLRLAAAASALAVAGFAWTRDAWAQSWNKAGFESKAVADALKSLGATGAVDSKDIVITAPDIAENGAVVPIAVRPSATPERRSQTRTTRTPDSATYNRPSPSTATARGARSGPAQSVSATAGSPCPGATTMTAPRDGHARYARHQASKARPAAVTSSAWATGTSCQSRDTPPPARTAVPSWLQRAHWSAVARMLYCRSPCMADAQQMSGGSGIRTGGPSRSGGG